MNEINVYNSSCVYVVLQNVKQHDPSKAKRKFSSFFKSLVIELDKDLYGPDNHLVEVDIHFEKQLAYFLITLSAFVSDDNDEKMKDNIF